MSLTMALMGAKAGAQILGAVQQKKYAGKFAELDREKASFYADYNQKEIDSAYDINIQNLISGYLDQRNELSKQSDQAHSDIAMQRVGTQSAVESSSFSNDMEDALNRSFMNGMADITEGQIAQSSELVAQTKQQSIQNQTTLSRTLSNITQTQAKVENQATMKMFNAALDLGMAGAEAGLAKGDVAGVKSDIKVDSDTGLKLNFGWLKGGNPYRGGNE